VSEHFNHRKRWMRCFPRYRREAIRKRRRVRSPIRALPRPSEAEKSLSLYDFRRPDRVSKDQMRTLQNLHEGYARQFSTTLTNFLRTFVEIELVSVDQLTYSESSCPFRTRAAFTFLKWNPLRGSAILEINPRSCSLSSTAFRRRGNRRNKTVN